MVGGGGGGGGGEWAFTWYITLYTILVQKWGVGAYMVMGAYKVLYSTYFMGSMRLGLSLKDDTKGCLTISLSLTHTLTGKMKWVNMQEKVYASQKMPKQIISLPELPPVNMHCANANVLMQVS